MERMESRHRRYGETLHTDKLARYNPLAAPRRNGVFEDLGSGLQRPSSQSSQKKPSQTRPKSRSRRSDSDFGSASEDEMDCFSQKSQGDETVVVKKKKKKNRSDYDPEVLEGKSHVIQKLKFSKNTKAEVDTENLRKPSTAASSSSKSKGKLDVKSPNSLRSNREDKADELEPSRDNTRARSDLPKSDTVSKKPRPRPKPVAPLPTSIQLDGETIVATNTSTTVKATRTRAQIPLLSPILKPTAGSSRRTSPPSSTNPSSTSSSNASTASSSSARPPPSLIDSSSLTPSRSAPHVQQPFPDLSPLHLSINKRSKVIASKSYPNVTSRTNTAGLSDFPAPSPLRDKARPVASKLSKKDKGKRKAVALAPFPMSTQDFRRRTPSDDETGSVRHARKRRIQLVDEASAMVNNIDPYEEEDSLFISPSVDPETLCPYCDSPLPPSPTPFFSKLLESALGKSHPDPRSTNPLGRKAPLSVFVVVCQRHDFETEVLPEAEAKGWPKSIDWEGLGDRVSRMKPDLKDIIHDSGEPDMQALINGEGGDLMTSFSCKGPRIRCVFWREAMKSFLKSGARGMADVRGQFLDFEKSQPGYYGELGQIIIQQTLLNMFPPDSFDPTLIKPFTATDFIQRILVPEVALRLIMEDRGLKGLMGAETALSILRESTTYGVTMFPEDSGEGVSSRKRAGRPSEIGVGDRIVMERAMKRRKEIEEGRDDDSELMFGNGDEEKKKGKRRAPDADNFFRLSEAEEVELPPSRKASKVTRKKRPATSDDDDDDAISIEPKSDGNDSEMDIFTDRSEVRPSKRKKSTDIGKKGKKRGVDVNADFGFSESEADEHERESPRKISKRDGKRKPRADHDINAIPPTAKSGGHDTNMSVDVLTDGSEIHSRPRRKTKPVNYTDVDSDEDLYLKDSKPGPVARPTSRLRSRTPSQTREISPSASEWQRARSPSVSEWGLSKRTNEEIGSKSPSLEILGVDICSAEDKRGTNGSTSKLKAVRTPAEKLQKSQSKQTICESDTVVDLDMNTPIPKRRDILRGLGNEDDATPKPITKRPIPRTGSQSNRQTVLSRASDPKDNKSKKLKLPGQGFKDWHFNLRSSLMPGNMSSSDESGEPVHTVEVKEVKYQRRNPIDTWLLFTQVWDYLSIENEVFGGPNSFAWVKSVICPSHIIASSLIMNLGSFTNLHSLELSFASEGVSTQDTVIHRLLDSFTRSATRMTLEKLTFTEIPRIDTKLLHSLSGTFPQLQSLELGSTKRIEFDCCIVCMEDSLECIRHSPIPDYYANAEKFAVDIASLSRSLAAMTKLKSLYLGILLSDAHILEEHFTHCDLDKGARGVVASLPSCNVCGEFREGTERREWSVSLALAQALPGLITVRWDTLFPPLACEGLESDEDGFYFTLEGDLVQVPSTVTFFIHRRSDSAPPSSNVNSNVTSTVPHTGLSKNTCSIQCGGSEDGATLPRAFKDDITSITVETNKIDKLIGRLRKERAHLQRRLNNLQSRTKVLPYEIISTIFRHICPQFDSQIRDLDTGSALKYPSERRISDLEEVGPLAPVILGAVSALWRQIAWSTPDLWTSFALKVNERKIHHQADLLHLYFQNAGNFPVSLELDFCGEFSNLDHPNDHTLAPIHAVILDHAPRVRSLRLSAVPLEWAASINGEFTSLENLALGWPFAGQVRRTQVLSFVDILALRRVTIQRLWAPLVLPWSQIVALDLDRMTIDTCVELLIECGNLEEYSMREPSFTPSDRRHPSLDGVITLDKLRVLVWTCLPDAWSIAMLEHVRFARLERIEWHGFPSDQNRNRIRDFFMDMPPTLQTLGLSRYDSSESLQETLINLPQVAHLELLSCQSRFCRSILHSLTPPLSLESHDQVLLPLLRRLTFDRCNEMHQFGTKGSLLFRDLFEMLHLRFSAAIMDQGGLVLQFKPRVKWRPDAQRVLAQLIHDGVITDILEGARSVAWL
ncbi:hypothetical protein NP233_g4012 [Leucocoprinus birnbaumii]|uniref:Restriction of telomere capping protein 4 n=1 Tax=Leucocoprinus birnbaumii TaxID=56174 RepID=A0AAD5YTC6_9AGAR|nr:hypothetical protein NP233_g4012 [Leucocoprinus birnbaumii]